jgi:hypothetical protein
MDFHTRFLLHIGTRVHPDMVFNASVLFDQFAQHQVMVLAFHDDLQLLWFNRLWWRGTGVAGQPAAFGTSQPLQDVLNRFPSVADQLLRGAVADTTGLKFSHRNGLRIRIFTNHRACINMEISSLDGGFKTQAQILSHPQRSRSWFWHSRPMLYVSRDQSVNR